VASLRPDVVLTDARLPDGTAVDVCRLARAERSTVRVVVVTSCTAPDAVYEAILAGVCAYLLVDISGDALVDAVRRVAAGQSMLDPAITGRVLDRLRHPGTGPPSPNGDHLELAALSVQERRILDLIVDGLTNREIGAVLRVSEQTVKNRVTGVLSKLGVTRRTQAAALGSRLRQRATSP
jgi:DNA-binding NarL/FixJ family response regulator